MYKIDYSKTLGIVYFTVLLNISYFNAHKGEEYNRGYADGSATTGITINKHHHTDACVCHGAVHDTCETWNNGSGHDVTCYNCGREGNIYFATSGIHCTDWPSAYSFVDCSYMIEGVHYICGKQEGQVESIYQGSTRLY